MQEINYLKNQQLGKTQTLTNRLKAKIKESQDPSKFPQ